MPESIWVLWRPGHERENFARDGGVAWGLQRREIPRLRVPALRAKPKARDTPLGMTWMTAWPGLQPREVLRLRFAPANTAGKEEPRETPLRMTGLADVRQTARKGYTFFGATMTRDDSRFARGIAHFNAQEFFAAHEVWEELWLVAPEPEKTFLQGLIQVAAAFHHHARENARGAKSLLAAGVAKLQGFPEDHRGIAVSDFRTEAKSWLEEIETGSVVKTRALPLICILDASGNEKTGE